MDRTRIDRDAIDPSDRTPALDRAWAATRPAELRADEFDRIWAEVRRAFDARPALLAMPRAPRSRRTLALVTFGLMQAAAVLVVAWALNRPVVTDRPSVVRDDPPAQAKAPVVVARLEVEPDETLILHLDAGRMIEQRRPAPAANEPLAMLDLPQHTPSDLLGFLETQSR